MLEKALATAIYLFRNIPTGGFTRESAVYACAQALKRDYPDRKGYCWALDYISASIKCFAMRSHFSDELS
jgi:hypothetical protein